MAGKYKIFGEHKSPIKDTKKLTLTWVTDMKGQTYATYIPGTCRVPPAERTKIPKTARWGRQEEAQMSNCNVEKRTSEGGRNRMSGELGHPAQI